MRLFSSWTENFLSGLLIPRAILRPGINTHRSGTSPGCICCRRRIGHKWYIGLWYMNESFFTINRCLVSPQNIKSPVFYDSVNRRMPLKTRARNSRILQFQAWLWILYFPWFAANLPVYIGVIRAVTALYETWLLWYNINVQCRVFEIAWIYDSYSVCNGIIWGVFSWTIRTMSMIILRVMKSWFVWFNHDYVYNNCKYRIFPRNYRTDK